MERGERERGSALVDGPQHTLTMVSPTRWRGRYARIGAVLRVPIDVPLKAAKRWVAKGIAKPGGEYAGGVGDSEPEVGAFAELEKQLAEDRERQIKTLSKRSKEALLEIAGSRLIDVNPESTNEEIARILVETEEDDG